MFEKVFLVLMIANFIGSLILFFVQLRSSKRRAFCCLLLTVFLPILGFMFCGFMFIRFNEKGYSMDDNETIQKYKIKPAEYIDESRSMRIVPANDALSLSDESNRRGFLLGLLRQRDMQSLRGTLQMALHNEDPEASHYAASAMMELQREAYTQMESAEEAYKEDEANYENATAYAASIMLYLENSEIGQLENYTFREKYETVLKRILKENEEECNPRDFENLINLYIKEGRLDEALSYCEKYVETFPRNENSYMLEMQVAYEKGDKQVFLDTFKAMRNSEVTLSSDALSMVRFWMQAGGANES